jgi:ABC-2 type transport system ATP-binding protein
MVLEVENVSKSFGNFKAVDGVSFSIQEREVVGLIGPNGAGKTTTIQMILGLISPNSGQIRIFGKPFKNNREAILAKMNFAAPYVNYPPRLTVIENLMIFAKLYNVRQASSKIAELLRLFEIADLSKKPVSRLSSGQTTRVGLCKAFLNDPKLLLLDEPTAFLDPQISLLVKRSVLDLQKRYGTTILLTSHSMDDVEEMCSQIYFLSHGKVIAEGSPLEVTRAVLKEDRKESALEEVFLRVASARSNETL